MKQRLTVYEAVLSEEGDLLVTFDSPVFAEVAAATEIQARLDTGTGLLSLSSPDGGTLELEDFPKAFQARITGGDDFLLAFQKPNKRWMALAARHS